MSRPAAAQIGAGTVLLGTALSLTGIMWDVQWHVDVGPDTFFTLSHLMLYAGSAVSGIGALVMVLRATAAHRAGRATDPAEGGRPITVLRVFTAPLGYLVAGAGAAMFLLYGLMDLWWHTVYGFDAVLGSPPHVALFSAITVTMVGAVIVYGYASDRRWGRAGLAIALPILMTFSPLTTNAFDAMPLPVDAGTVGSTLFGVLCLVLGLAVVGRPGYTLVIAVVLGAMQAFFWWFAPWASHTYAAATGLPLRDNLADRAPALPALSPVFLLLVALVIEAVFRYARRTGGSPRWTPPIAGALGGLVLALTLDLQRPLIHNGRFFADLLVADAVAGLLAGALGAYAGYRFAGMLRGETVPREPAVRALGATA